MGKDSAEVSAEASVKVAEASVSAESHFRPIRSFTNFHNLFLNYLIVESQRLICPVFVWVTRGKVQKVVVG